MLVRNDIVVYNLNEDMALDRDDVELFFAKRIIVTPVIGGFPFVAIKMDNEGRK